MLSGYQWLVDLDGFLVFMKSNIDYFIFIIESFEDFVGFYSPTSQDYKLSA